MKPGDRTEWHWTPTQADFDRFARISGDDNPIHVDPAFAAATRFGRTVAHGMLLYGVLWSGLKSQLPLGRQLSQTLMFRHPAYAGEALAASATVLAQTAATVTLAVSITRLSNSDSCLEGDAVFDLMRAAP
jgi:3-hydroxybutyryl-CoA dehydratase